MGRNQVALSGLAIRDTAALAEKGTTMKRYFATIVLAALVFSVSCGDDPADPDIPPVPPDLTSRSDVLFLMESACNERKIAQYERVLDDNFIFYIAPGDMGGNIPTEWGRADEINLVARMFDRNVDPGFPLVTSLRMDIEFESSLQWIEVVPASAPDETWYMTTLFYEFQMMIDPDAEYVTVPGTKAQFTVRNAGTEVSPQWQLVEMRDLGAPVSVAMATAASTDEVTWGAAKALFLPAPATVRAAGPRAP